MNICINYQECICTHICIHTYVYAYMQYMHTVYNILYLRPAYI